MIINCSKHGRSRRDTAKLAAHLYKSENDFTILAEIGNSAATDLKGVLRDMELLRDGSIPRAAAFHHFPLSPATDRTHAEILEAAHALRREFDEAGTRPFCILIQGKERAGGADGRVHGHFVLGNFDSNNRALKDNFTKLRTERLAREIEYSWRESSPGSPGEPCGLGRHHASSLRALRKSRPELAAWLVNAHGETPAKPKSAISSASRDRAKRLNFDLPAARASVQKMWAETLEIGAFRTALSNAGYEIAAGTKPGVWVLQDNASGFVLGAVDRLLKVKRQAIRNMMETTDDRKQQIQSGPSAAHGRARTKTVRPDQGNRGVVGPTATVVGADREKGRGAGGRPHRANTRSANDYRHNAAEAGSAPASSQSQARFHYRPLERRRAIQRLNRIDVHRILALAALYASHRPFQNDHFEEMQSGPSVLTVDGKDIWGIPVLKPHL